jgi:hypothetical protein
LQDHQFLVSCPPLPEEGPLPVDLASTVSEAPEAEENQDGDEAEESGEDTSSTTSPPPSLSEDTRVDKKRKRVDELTSSSTSLCRELRILKPLFSEKMLSSLTSWHHKCPLKHMSLQAPLTM